jgi:hypothetical protein
MDPVTFSSPSTSTLSDLFSTLRQLHRSVDQRLHEPEVLLSELLSLALWPVDWASAQLALRAEEVVRPLLTRPPGESFQGSLLHVLWQSWDSSDSML